MDFKKWTEEFGGEQAVEALNNVNKSSEYREIPDGKYMCQIDKLELAESKAGKPMVKGQFRIMEGEYRKQCLFYNQVITKPYPMHLCVEFLRSLNIFDDSEVVFTGDFEEFNDLLLDMAEEAESAEKTYLISKTTDGDYTRLSVAKAY